MFQITSKSKMIFTIAILTGSIGAIGQAYLLHHELVDSYPYKMMDHLFYRDIANVGIYLAPFLAIVGGLLFGMKRLWLTTVTPVFLCPLLFSGIYKVSSVLSLWNGTFDNGVTFDGKTPAIVEQEFFTHSVELIITGFIVGAVCNYLLWCLSKPKKLS